MAAALGEGWAGRYVSLYDSELGGTSCRYPHRITPTLAERMSMQRKLSSGSPQTSTEGGSFRSLPGQDEAAIAGLPEDFCRYGHDSCRATPAATRPERVACQ